MRESKNILQQNQGQLCERKALKFYQEKNFKVIGTNLKINSVEIDLILFKQHYFFVEVKSLRREDEISFRLSLKQITRLMRARDYYSSIKNEDVEIRVLYVLQHKMIELGIEDHF